MSVCAPLKKNKEECEEDFQCKITHFCWYATQEDRQNEKKKCIETYSQENEHKFGWLQQGDKPTLEDHTHNGRYCKSGLAYESAPGEAQCVETQNIKFKGKVLEEPYACEAEDPFFKCQIVFGQKENDEGVEEDLYTETPCRCSLAPKDFRTPDAKASAYCGSVLGTQIYAKAVRAKKLLYEKSNCHTLDRDDFRA